MKSPELDQVAGRTLGDFVVLAPIGEGGNGVVYRAHQPLLGREAVIKILRGRRKGDPDGVQRFLREARLASSLDHPFAAHVYAFGAEPDGLLWIAMEMVHGTPLDEFLEKSGPIPLERFVPFFERLCEVVHTAHERGIIHRDLKPANAMVLSRAGRMLPKLLDLGIARLLDDPSSESFPSGGDSAALLDAKLTREDTVVGSPWYMPREQWIEPSKADARTDLYALGVLAYEALTGRRPFDGESILAIARAHAFKPMPPLGEGFPAALGQVIARALAKVPGERFATALDFALAMRQAAGLVEERPSWPKLDEALRDDLFARAPQPLAEAISALEGARNPNQARDALRDAVQLAARYLGILALAACSRVGMTRSTSPRVTELLHELRRRSLSPEQWMDLARELCRPFAKRPDVHPLPELVLLFFSPESAATERFSRLFTLLFTRGSSPLDINGQLEQGIALLGQVLPALSFLHEYPLVVAKHGVAESWTGIRRSPRTVVGTRGPALRDHEPTVLDRMGVPILSLSPLAQVAAPAPGSPEELFLLEGAGRHGAKLVSLPHGYERHDDGPWEWFRQNLLEMHEQGPVSSEDQAPYQGLLPFGQADSTRFLGREREADAFLNRLRSQPFLAVVGPSGAGKSSFVQAGVIPGLPASWRTIVLRPGASPLASIRERLARDGILAQGSTDSRILAERVRAWTHATGNPLILVVDQLEELFTLCPGREERVEFARVLVEVARSAEDSTRVVVTLRDDFLVRTQELSPFRERLNQGIVLITTPARDDLLRILVSPALRAGYDFEDKDLPLEMVAAVADKPSALALLSFTAAKLWELRDRHFKQLPRRVYTAMGGVGGALARHAEETIALMTLDEQALVREAFRHLVTAEGTRAVVTRSELSQVLRGGERAEAVVEKLIAARLLSAQEGEGGEERVEVVHEALLAAWPRVSAWRQEDREGARMRDQLRAAARQWTDRGRPNGLLWRGDALTEYRLWRGRYPGMLTEAEEAFARASVADSARSRRARTLVVAGSFLALTIGLFVLFQLRLHADRSAAQAKAQLAENYMEQGRQALLSGDAHRALLFLNEAYQMGVRTPSLNVMLGAALRPFEALRAVLPHGAKVWHVSFSPDGARVVTSCQDGKARIWEVATGKLLTTLSGHKADVFRAAFDPTGTRVVTASWDKTARIWDATDGRLLHELGGHEDMVLAAEFDRHGDFVATASAMARIWDARRGTLLATLLPGHEGGASNVAFSSDSRHLVTSGFDGAVKLWEIPGGKLVRTMTGHKAEVIRAAFSPDGTRIVTASWDNTAKVWDAGSGALVCNALGHQDKVDWAEFSPDGRRILTASSDKTARIWDAADGRRLVTLEGHAGKIFQARFTKNGERVITTSWDGSARIFDAMSGKKVGVIPGHASPLAWTELAPDDTVAVTASWDGTAMIWDLAPKALILSARHPARVLTASFDPQAKRFVTGSEDHAIRAWDATSGTLLWSSMHKGIVDHVEYSPDGTRVLSASRDGTARIWDAATGKPTVSFTGHGGEVEAAAFRADGERIVSVASDATIQIWRTSDGTVLSKWMKGPQNFVSFSPDGSLVATAGEDGMARLWDARNGQLVHSLSGHEDQVHSIRFSRDGDQLVTASADGTARTWDVTRGELLRTLEGHGGHVVHAAFSSDGVLVVTAADDQSARIWDAKTGRPLLSLDAHAAWVTSATFDPQATRVLTASWDGLARVFEVPRVEGGTSRMAALVECLVPLRLVDGVAQPRQAETSLCQVP
ncbi:MAG: protein kinase [Deltaproteobacteria bacterium]|nr:protein kinase [Deltaproteobacteria bacterium]